MTMEDHKHVLNSHILPLPLLSEQPRYKLHRELPCLMIHQLGPHERSNLPVISEITSLVSVDDFGNFLHIFVCVNW